MKNLAALVLVVGSLMGSVSQAQFVYPAPLLPVYPAPVAFPAPLLPVVPAPVATPVVPVYPVAPNCAWVTVPVSSWQWVQGIFGGWHLRWVTTYQNQLVCR